LTLAASSCADLVFSPDISGPGDRHRNENPTSGFTGLGGAPILVNEPLPRWRFGEDVESPPRHHHEARFESERADLIAAIGGLAEGIASVLRRKRDENAATIVV
jgi:hypothetical protein